MQMLAFPKRLRRAASWWLLSCFISAALVPIMGSAAAQTYADMTGHWAQPCIQQLTQAEIVSGYPGNQFRPAQPITRAEYAALLSQAFPGQSSVRGTANFRDVSPSYWGYEAIQTAYQKGFLTGYPDRQFRPDDLIERAEAFVALASGLNFAPPSDSQQLLRNTFIDAPAVPAYAIDAIAAGVEKGIVISPPESEIGALMSPRRPITRAQAAAALCQVKFPDAPGVPAGYVVEPGGLASDSPTVRLGPVCTNPVAGYRVRYPEGWMTNSGETANQCRYFDPEELTIPERAETFDEAISLRRDSLPYDQVTDSDDITQSVLSRRTLTIDGRQATVTEAETTGRGILPAGIRSYTYVVDLGDSIFVGSTYDTDGQSYQRNKQVLDLMVGSLEFI